MVDGLPDPGPFRVSPTRAACQRAASPRPRCGDCLGGTCCQSEDAIYLTAFDILRLAAFFDLSPGDFLQRFTQERFAEGPLEPYRRQTIDDPESSVVTYLRRRSNRSYSPCIFLTYVVDRDGTPRRQCGVHAARPLACREYYDHHCRARATGELAVLHAHMFEMIRDGRVSLDLAHARRERLRPLLTPEAPMSAWLEYAVWTEAVRALRHDEANEEGANSYAIADYQDPLDEKIDRLLSKQRLRLEERYGWVPHGDQLQAYRGGLSFVDSPEHRRLLRIVATPPSHGLFEDGDYPFFAANRLTIEGMRKPRAFLALGAARKARLLDTVPTSSLFPAHRDPRIRATTARDVWRAALDAADALTVFASYIARLGITPETAPPGTLEWELLYVLRRLKVDRHPVLKLHPGLRQIEAWAWTVVRPDATRRRRLDRVTPTRRAAPAMVRRLLDTQGRDGNWACDPDVARMPDSQAAYLRAWMHTTAAGLLMLRPPPVLVSRPR
jgi:Fe-S-cluster containining protein